MSRLRPDAVVNCAAWTDVDGAESAYDASARGQRRRAPATSRAAAAACGAWVVHVSSDYVFDGTSRIPVRRVRRDRAAVRRTGARSSTASRRWRLRRPESHTIVRSSWLFGTGGKCFPKTILPARGRAGSSLTVVDDQLGCPTFTGHLASAIVRLCATADARGGARRRCRRVLVVRVRARRSWRPPASTVRCCRDRDRRVSDASRAAPRLQRPAHRARRSVPELPDWRDGLARFMSEPRVGVR